MNKKELIGLNQTQVDEKISQGLTNDFTSDTSTSNWQIVKRNVFTLFNALNFVIAVALVSVQAWSNLVFFAVISFNAVTGIITELRAKRMIDKLNLVSRELVTVIRDGQEVKIQPEEIVLGDLIKLSAGEQIPSDARVVEGVAEANEAMLTGRVTWFSRKKAPSCCLVAFWPVGRFMLRCTMSAQTTMPTSS